MVRLQKFLAESGVASRRASEQIIAAGRVTVNGAVAAQLGVKVDGRHDRVTVDGRLVAPRRKFYIAVNKPPGIVCTRGKEDDRPKIGDLLPKEWSDLFSVGRLDYQSEGLIFLTNDGDFCLKLTHPRYRIPRIYMASVEGRVLPEMLKKFTQGVMSAGEKLQAQRARLVSANNSHSVVQLELMEGKNREVRRLFESQNLSVERLQRVQIGPIKLGQLPVGKWRVLTGPEIKSLLPVL
ncbi:MAG TPA: pseudouridine synthase [Candidatus Saccharimonadales bacterium]|nr:pseudouridine synthase [Candidatus Saccharimonadales bacterium]